MSISLTSVFVVDDEAVISRTLSIILNQSGFRAVPYIDPKEALAAARQAPPDLLISDVMMPGMTGIQLAIEIRAFHPAGRILLFSGQAQTADLLGKAREAGYDFDLLTKPVHPADLLAKIRGL